MRYPASTRAMLGIALALLLLGCQSTAPAPRTFYNPLNTLNGPDPWLLFYEGSYYLTTTQGSDLRMWKSPTLAGLATAAPTTIWSDATPARCCNVWAPEFHLLDGPDGLRWYVYYSAGTDGSLDNQRMHVLESSGTDPLGPYTYKARIFDPTDDGWAIDGSVLKMPDGALYYMFSSWVGPDQTMFIAPMSDPWTISGPRALLSKPTYDWERSVGNVNEGPEALIHDGKIFVVYSASACWGPDYKLGMLTYAGGDPLSTGAWLKSPEPVFARSDANGVYAPGHNGFFTSPDGKESWIVYHANAGEGDGCVGKRTTRAQPFTWNDDGTPNFGVPLPLDAPIPVPSGEVAAEAPRAAAVSYALVGKADGRCLGLSGGAQPQLGACDEAAGQQWGVDYLGNGHYRLTSRAGGQSLEVTAAAAQEGAPIGAASWSYGPGQQWKILTAGGGWLRILARHSSMAVGCAADGGAALRQAVYDQANSCQQFRLQPLGELRLLSAGSNKALTVAEGATADGAPVQLWGAAGAAGQRWSFVHRSDGFYQVVAAHSGKCLAAAGDPAANGAAIAQAPCGDGPGQQWRLEPLNDGTLRLVARDSGKVLDVRDCRMSDGAALQQWSWLDNMCQRLYLAAP